MIDNHDRIESIVDREGPITLDELLEYKGIFGKDDTYIVLVELMDEGKVEKKQMTKDEREQYVWVTPHEDST